MDDFSITQLLAVLNLVELADGYDQLVLMLVSLFSGMYLFFFRVLYFFSEQLCSQKNQLCECHIGLVHLLLISILL